MDQLRLNFVSIVYLNFCLFIDPMRNVDTKETSYMVLFLENV